MVALIRRAWQYGRRSTLVAEAATLLVLARIALRIVPVKRIFALLDRPTRLQPNRSIPTTVRQVHWAIQRARHAGVTVVCFPQAIAARLMLARRGVPSTVHYGVGSAERRYAAHVWVSVDGVNVVGGEDAGGFHVLLKLGNATDRAPYLVD